MFEIEFRARFDEATYNKLKAYLDEHAEVLGEDNKDCHYFIFPDKLLKLVHNISKKNAKISLKLSSLGQGAAFEEIEFTFPEGQIESARKLLDALALPVKTMHEGQQRVNYTYKGCEIALKYSKTWGYHLEIEQVIDRKEKQAEAEVHIREVANELDVHLMSDEDLRLFLQEVESRAE
jgi:adenylate cyclase class IV